MLRSGLLTGLLGLTLFTCGCSGQPGDQPDLAPVSGFVTMDGAPVAGLRVSFQPEKGRISSGTTDASGTYNLIYLRDLEGAVVGKHTVKIDRSLGLGPDASDAASGGAEPIVVPKRYNAETTLTAEVVEGENLFSFELTSEP